jgi:hypothetical protein
MKGCSTFGLSANQLYPDSVIGTLISLDILWRSVQKSLSRLSSDLSL